MKEPRLPFHCLVFIEAPMASLHHPDRFDMLNRFFKFIWLRQDTWASPRAVEREFRANPLYSTWDAEALALYLVRRTRSHVALR